MTRRTVIIILGLDFETSGREPKTHSVVEVGAALWCTELRRIIRSTGYLVFDRNTVWEDGASEVNGITDDQCAAFGIESEKALKQLISYYMMAHAVCTYNGTIFDRPFYENWCDRFGYTEYRDQNKIWIDAKVDLPFKKEKWHNLDLTSLAAHHGILHRNAHGALPDANITLELFDMYPLHQVMESAMSPTVIVQAMVSFNEKDKAKARGYYWRPEKKQWIKSIKAYRVQDEVAQAAAGVAGEDGNPIPGFAIKIIEK